MERVLADENLRRRRVRDAALEREWRQRQERERGVQEEVPVPPAPAPPPPPQVVEDPPTPTQAPDDAAPPPPPQVVEDPPTPTQAPYAEPETEPTGPAVCRICHGGADEGDSPLFSPCLCRGSMGKVHVDCLNSWRRMSANPNSYFKCDQCGYQYRVSRWKHLDLAQSAQFIGAVALLGMLLVIFLLGNANGSVRLPVGRHFCRLVRWRPPWWSWQAQASFAGRLRVEGLTVWNVRAAVAPSFDVLLSGGVVLGGLAFAVVMAQKIRLHPQYFLRYVAPSLAVVYTQHGIIILRVLTALGLVAAYVGAYDHVLMRARQYCMRYGEVVLGYGEDPGARAREGWEEGVAQVQGATVMMRRARVWLGDEEERQRGGGGGRAAQPNPLAPHRFG